MIRAWVTGMACAALLVGSARADDGVPGDARQGSIVKVDVDGGLVHVRVGDKDVAVNLKDIQFLRGKLRFRLAERREANKLFLAGEDGKVTELQDLKAGEKIFYMEKDGKITHFVFPNK